MEKFIKSKIQNRSSIIDETEKENILVLESINKKQILNISDTLDILSGKWRIQIIISLFKEPKRFCEISRELKGITDRTLSKELKDLEQNLLIEKKLHINNSSIIEYNITEHTLSLMPILIDLKDWGIYHREKIIYINYSNDNLKK